QDFRDVTGQDKKQNVVNKLEYDAYQRDHSGEPFDVHVYRGDRPGSDSTRAVWDYRVMVDPGGNKYIPNSETNRRGSETENWLITGLIGSYSSYNREANPYGVAMTLLPYNSFYSATGTITTKFANETMSQSYVKALGKVVTDNIPVQFQAAQKQVYDEAYQKTYREVYDREYRGRLVKLTGGDSQAADFAMQMSIPDIEEAAHKEAKKQAEAAGNKAKADNAAQNMSRVQQAADRTLQEANHPVYTEQITGAIIRGDNGQSLGLSTMGTRLAEIPGRPEGGNGGSAPFSRARFVVNVPQDHSLALLSTNIPIMVKGKEVTDMGLEHVLPAFDINRAM
ncbi:MAG: hypothetical protein HQL13_08180, partial [Candidatus Omnitrophica bacterium]|nr:hypothetical protein [Candidatus Omnitrophota bacterium]